MNRDQPPPADKTAAIDAPGSTGGPSRNDPNVVGKSHDDFPGERRSKRTGLTVTHFRDINTSVRKVWLVQGMLGAGELSCLYGHPGSTKSLIAGDLAFHIAAGQEWFGRKTQQGGVIYVAAERAFVVMRRFHALKLHSGQHDIPLAVVSGSVDLRRNLDHTLAIAEFANKLAAESGTQPALIVIDTINRALAGGDENTSSDMGLLIGRLTRLQETTRAHVLTVHHMPVDGSRMRGHGSLLGACDTTALVVKDSTDAICTVTVQKANDGPEGEKFAYALKSIDLHQDSETGEITSAPIAVQGTVPPAGLAPRLTRSEATMLQVLQEAGETGLTKHEWYQRARDKGVGQRTDGTPDRRATRAEASKRLAEKGLVELKGGRCFVVPEAAGVTRYGG